MSAWPPFATRELVYERLPLIFPEGTPNRVYCTRELAASTVFAALYIGAVAGAGHYFGPMHVYRMTEEQACKASDSERVAYRDAVQSKSQIAGTRWYADNTREPIRDESLRDGLVAVGAIRQHEDLPTTSGRPRYFLEADFALLFNPALTANALEAAIRDFQSRHLSKSALARVTIMRAGAAASLTGVLVKFPNGETRQLAPGPSSFITQAVVEVFAPRFLKEPAVLWLSESGNKVVLQDERLATAIGLNIQADKNLPDLILVDLAPRDPLILFVEVVATDGAMVEQRRQALFKLTDDAGFSRQQVAFLTAYEDRQSAGFKKTVAQLAWGSFAWFASEPAHIVRLHEGNSASTLSELLQTR